MCHLQKMPGELPLRRATLHVYQGRASPAKTNDSFTTPGNGPSSP